MAVMPVDVSTAVATTGQAGRRKRGDGKAAAGFLTPSMLGLLAFTAFPIVASLIIGFYNWPVIGGHTFTGLKNYQTLLNSKEFHTSIVPTCVSSWFISVKKRSPGEKASIDSDSGATSSSTMSLGEPSAAALP